MGIGRWSSVLVLGGAAILYSCSGNAHGKAVESPLPLAVQDKQIVIPDFTAAASGMYLIEVEFQTASQANAVQVGGAHYLLGCMAGVLKGPLNCKDQPDLLDVTWSVASDGRFVGLGASRDFEGEGSADDPNRKMTRLIGRFRAEKGDTYLLKLNLHAAPPDLVSGGPKLIVRPALTD